MYRSEYSNTAQRTTQLQPHPLPTSQDTVQGPWPGADVSLEISGANLLARVKTYDGDAGDWLSLGVTQIRIEFSGSSTFANDVQSFDFVSPQGTLTHEFTGLAASTTYYLRAFVVY